MKKGTGLVMSLLGLLFLSNIVIARDHRVFTGSINLAGEDVTNLLLEVPNGMVNINVVDSDVITYKVKVEDKPTAWNLFEVDLDDLELVTEQSASSLHLMIDEKGVSQKWVLNVPRELALQVNMGVGNVDVDGFSQSLAADIGVGSAWVAVNSADYHHVGAEVGVGEIQAQGFELASIDKKRLMVSDQLTISGEGSQRIDIKIGVGDVNLSYFVE